MKFIKIIAVILLIAMLGCSFIACQPKEDGDEGDTEEYSDVPAPEGNISEGITEITISFDIKDGSTGNNIYHEVNYTYKGFDPTIMGVLKYYIEVKKNDYFGTYEDDESIIESIGDYTAAKGQSWVTLNQSTDLTIPQKDNTSLLENTTLRNLIKFWTSEATDEYTSAVQTYITNNYLIESASEHVLKDGEYFAIVLAGEPSVEDETEAEENADQ